MWLSMSTNNSAAESTTMCVCVCDHNPEEMCTAHHIIIQRSARETLKMVRTLGLTSTSDLLVQEMGDAPPTSPARVPRETPAMSRLVILSAILFVIINGFEYKQAVNIKRALHDTRHTTHEECETLYYTREYGVKPE
ncbi:unnamed protein product [Danaus chrysippus]|uniref:(African queen) hypothetical protein n=1 Tax=Danaus chrysippus TaxID=151541 RepID=A0A8J2WFV8_9NEOP|nr:unnamed protein product [Danaus chrysippus]